MQSLGNNFMVIDATINKFKPSSQQLKTWSSVNFGVGFDQLLLIEPSSIADFKYRIFNADGSEVEQCGNGARCFAKYIADNKLSNKTKLKIEISTGMIELEILANKLIAVNMGKPKFEPKDIPIDFAQAQDKYSLKYEQELLEFQAVSIGNPHAVFSVPDVDSYPVQLIGQFVESHSLFPNKVNVGFMEIINRQQIKLRVYERAVGETFACGSGACAAVVCGIKAGLLDQEVKVGTLGGFMQIKWQGDDIVMTGDAHTVYQGLINI